MAGLAYMTRSGVEMHVHSRCGILVPPVSLSYHGATGDNRSLPAYFIIHDLVK
jgi:hypothetical protein